MKIFRLSIDVNRFKGLYLVDEHEKLFFQKFDGSKIKRKWKIPEVEFYEEDKNLREGDAYGFFIPVLNSKAVESLLPLAGDDVELLPMRHEKEILYGLNVTTVLDVIDYEKSEYKKFKDGQRIMYFKKFVFKTDAILGHNIFKIGDERLKDAFVTESFKKRIEQCGLLGFKLDLVYDDATDPVELVDKKENEGGEKTDNSRFSGTLEKEFIIEIDRNYKYALSCFGLSGLSETEAIQHLHDIVEKGIYKLKVPGSYADINEVIVGLGVLFGQLICLYYGWQWKKVFEKGTGIVSVVSKDEQYCIYPLLYMQNIITGKENTVLLLFNMIAKLETNTETKELCLLS